MGVPKPRNAAKTTRVINLQLASTQTYFAIPASGIGAAGIDFNQTILGYDSMDRLNREAFS